MNQTNLEREAQQLGFPATLFGFTPNERAYWHEPGLPWFTVEMSENPPLDYQGVTSIICIADVATDSMAPRFPRNCALYTMPVFEKAQLVVGRVYTYSFRDSETGALRANIARLVKIGGNYLEVTTDNGGAKSLWLLREEPSQATWDVREVTHYVSYPSL